MPTVTYADLYSLLKKGVGEIPEVDAEDLIDQAIRLLNTFGADLPVMGGTAGAKTVALDNDVEMGAVMQVARDIFMGFYVDLYGVTGDVAIRPNDPLLNPEMYNRIHSLARRLVKPRGRRG